jgi:hypothetical protein
MMMGARLATRLARLERQLPPTPEPRVTTAFFTEDGLRTHVQINWGPYRSDPWALALPLPADGSCKVIIGVNPDDL